MTTQRLLRVRAAFVTALVVSSRVEAGSVHLMWDANPEPDVAGYVILFGTEPGNYTHSLDVGSYTSWVISDLADGQRHYFAVRAYNTEGVAGDPSNEVSHLACGYQLDRATLSMDAAGGAAVTQVWAGNECPWSAASDSGWLTVTAASPGHGDGSVSYTVAPNTGGARVGTLTIADQSVTVQQAGASVPTCTTTLSKTRDEVGWKGETARVKISTGSTCEWTALSTVSWIRVLDPSGTGSATLRYEVRRNWSARRTGTILVGDQILTVVQSRRR